MCYALTNNKQPKQPIKSTMKTIINPNSFFHRYRISSGLVFLKLYDNGVCNV